MKSELEYYTLQNSTAQIESGSEKNAGIAMNGPKHFK